MKTYIDPNIYVFRQSYICDYRIDSQVWSITAHGARQTAIICSGMVARCARRSVNDHSSPYFGRSLHDVFSKRPKFVSHWSFAAHRVRYTTKISCSTVDYRTPCSAVDTGVLLCTANRFAAATTMLGNGYLMPKQWRKEQQ